MPRHNRPDLAQSLRTRYDTDPPAGFDTIGPEIVPVAVVDVLLTPEQKIPRLRGESAAAAVGAVGEIGIRTDDGLLYVEKALVSVGAAASVRVRTGAPAGTTTSFQTFQRDLRRGLAASNQGLVTRANDHATGSGSEIGRVILPANRVVEVPLGIWVGDNAEFHLDCVTQNLLLNVVFFFDYYWLEALVP